MDGEIILIYSLLGYEGEQDFRTFDYYHARKMARKYGLKVISRQYKFQSGRIVRNSDDAEREMVAVLHK